MEEIFSERKAYSAFTVAKAAETITELKQKLESNLEGLCLAYGWMWKDKPQTISVLKHLSGIECDKRLRSVLQTHESEEEKQFDSIYREKSSLAVKLILGHLQSRLRELNYSVQLSTEQRSQFSIADVSIEMGNPCKILLNGVERIRLEVKASLGVPLEQISRYLYDSTTLIIARIATSHWLRLRPNEFEDYITFSLKESISRSERLLNDPDGEDVLPGNYCRDCLVKSCKFNRNNGRKGSKSPLIKMNNDAMQADLEQFFGNVAEVSRRVADLVIEELSSEAHKEGTTN